MFSDVIYFKIQKLQEVKNMPFFNFEAKFMFTDKK